MALARNWAGCVGCILSLVVAGCGEPRQTMTFATGNPSGIFYPYGGALASIWSRALPDVNMKAEVTGASLINVIQVARGESEVGIAMGDVVASAVRGTDRFPEALPVRTLFAAYPNLIHVVARADAGIERISDLRGKRVSMGAPGSGTAIAAENVLSGLGIGEQEMTAYYLNFSGTTDGLKDGVLDAGFVVGGLGIGVVKELALTRDVMLVPITAREAASLGPGFEAYAQEVIPAGTYRGVNEPVQTLATWNLVVVNASMSDTTAYDLLCVLYRERAALQRVVPVASFTVPENGDRIDSVPMHPGATRLLADVRARGLDQLACGDR